MKQACRSKMKAILKIKDFIPFGGVLTRACALASCIVLLQTPAYAQRMEGTMQHSPLTPSQSDVMKRMSEIKQKQEQKRQQYLQQTQQRRTPASSSQAELAHHTLTVGGESRDYDIFVPSTYSRDRYYPMIIVLHGGGGNAEFSEKMTRFLPWAVAKEFILVHPNGSGRLRNSLLTWNAGNCCAYAYKERVDDVGFISALIDHISKEVNIDPRRVYVAGLSNGAKMAYRLACQLSDKIAAIAPVAGSMEEPDCVASSAVSVIAFHGTADKHVLYEGGAPEKSADRLPRVDNSVAKSVGYWVNNNQCNPLPAQSQTGSVRMDWYTGCMSGSEVILYSIIGGGHAWPGGTQVRSVADTPTTEIDATKEIVNFFLSHPKK